MNYLCVCQYGHSRSVALARVLHSMQQTAVAVGAATGGSGVECLCDWADKILLVAGDCLQGIPPCCRSKIVNFDVGPDRWSDPYNRDLINLLKKMVWERLPELRDIHSVI